MRKKAEKILVLGIDGLDPRLTRKYLDEGVLPNISAYLKRGAARQDLMLLGGHPTVTPSMWTTLATGCYATVHGITDFYRQNPEHLDQMDYNLDSRLCQAEQLWNVFAEAGKKTLVWHWPGSSWPPSSESANLHVVDGSSPGGVNMSNCQFEAEYLVVADPMYTEPTFRPKSGNEVTPCIIKDLAVEDPDKQKNQKKFGTETSGQNGLSVYITQFGEGAGSKEYKFDMAVSPIKEPEKWAFAMPEGAKEFTLLLSGGLIRRSCLICTGSEGVYDTVVIYKNKKTPKPLATLKKGVFEPYIFDEAIRKDEVCQVIRHMRIVELAEDGNHLMMYVSAAMAINNDTLFHPKHLYRSVVDNIGFPPPSSMLFPGKSKALFWDCALAGWDVAADWQSRALHHLIAQEKYDVVFSHFHNVDIQDHTFYKYMAEGTHAMTPNDFVALSRDIYRQTDCYLGSFLHYLDEGWTIFIVSDHGLVAHNHDFPLIGDMNGLNVGVMQELGFTVLQKDAQGHDIKAVDWSKTKAVANRGCHIYLNLKGRQPEGIVEPADKWQVEEEIMTALYGYHDKKTGQRIIGLALRNKDAVLLGLGGPESGDIVYWTAEGYNYDHTDCLSTTYGIHGTSASPIFIAAGPGIKADFVTTRYIRETDLAPTMAVLGGVRMPKECEGAPVYQILEDDYAI